jgi:hypothetical protein
MHILFIATYYKKAKQGAINHAMHEETTTVTKASEYPILFLAKIVEIEK